jgi:hypothetical protein
LIYFWALHNGGMNFVSRKVAKEQRRKVLDFEFLVSEDVLKVVFRNFHHIATPLSPPL